MIRYFLLATLLYVGCNNPEQKQTTTVNADSGQVQDKTKTIAEPVKTDTQLNHVYSNQRFKDVTVEKLDGDSFRVKGRAQVFEANLSWVVEDGHEELKKGFQMTSAGAPEWGEFVFTIDVEKKRPNSTLTLILFESSSKDGSRQFELPIPLY